MTDATVRLGELRRWRSRPDRAVAIEPLIAARLKEARRLQKTLGSFVELWETVLPDELARRTQVTGLRSGIVHVTVASSATAYELDRRLREGLEEQMRRAFGKTLVRVKIAVSGQRSADRFLAER